MRKGLVGVEMKMKMDRWASLMKQENLPPYKMISSLYMVSFPFYFVFIDFYWSRLGLLYCLDLYLRLFLPILGNTVLLYIHPS